MRGKLTLSTVVLAGGLALASAGEAAEELCPMGGTLVAVEVDKAAALAWARELRRSDVADEAGAWRVLTVSEASPGIALLVAEGQVFFGVAGRGGEVYPRDLERAFGADLRKLREAVGKGMRELWKARVARIAGGDVERVAAAAGLGVVARDGEAWRLTTRECQAVDLPASGL